LRSNQNSAYSSYVCKMEVGRTYSRRAAD